MIVTLTLNPAVDKTIRVRRMTIGQVHRVEEAQLDPAGKGINVSRMVDRLGWPTIAFGFLAGEIGVIVEKALVDEGVQSHFLRLAGQTRLNVTIFDERSGIGTSFYEKGPHANRRQLQALLDEIQPWLLVCDVLVLAGSILPGVPSEIYADYIRLARDAGAKTILDADGEPLRRGLAALPSLIKPNVKEAERLVGHPLPDLDARVQAAREIVDRGIETVVISMGKEGAILSHGAGVWLAIPPEVVPRSTVGSGDSMVAGLAIALARKDDLIDGLRLATAAGASTAMVPGTLLGSSADVHALLPQVRVERLV